MQLRDLRLVSALLLPLLLAPALHAGVMRPQDAEGAAPAATATPDSVDAAVAVETDELEEELAGYDRARLDAVLAHWMELVERQQAAFESAESAAEGSDERRGATALGSDRDALVVRAELVVAALATAGGSADEARERLATIRVSDTQRLDNVSTVPPDPTLAQDLDLEVLRAQLRPLTKDQVQAELDDWQTLLQEKCLEVRNVEVAALQAEESDEESKFNERAVELRGQRGRLIERVKVVLDALDEKNGETDDARAYLKSIVVAPPIQGWRAAWTTMRAWLTSPDGGIELGLGLARAIGVLILFAFLSRIVGTLAARAVRNMKRASELLREFIVGSFRKAVVFLGFLIAAGQLGIDMGPLLAVIGAAGLVVGFALQGTLSNFASGLLIMIYRPFDVGDLVEVAGVTGKVEGMTLVTTLIRTLDNRSMNVPNNSVWGDVITNITANPTRRVDMTFGISYGDDVDRAKELLLDTVKNHPLVLADPEPTIEVHTLGESSVDFVVRPWAATADYWKVYWALNRAVKQRFDAEGVSIPFPQRDVHVRYPEGSPYELPRPEGSEAEPAREAAAEDAKA